MKRIVISGLVCLLAGMALARYLPQLAAPEPPPVEASGFDPTLPLEERIAELERAVSDERQARQFLEDEVFYLTATVADLAGGGAEAMPPQLAGAADLPDPDEPARQRFRRRNDIDGRTDRLVDAGFTPDRAEWIVQRESRFRMSLLEARHEAERAGTWDGYAEARETAEQAFREELGATDYERYLEGTGRPTAVVVGSVMDTSPAQRAGLLPGDRILSYGNTRIYGMSDLNRATLEGSAGETVYLQIERNGQPMQIAIPRGPVGITGGGSRRRSQ